MVSMPKPNEKEGMIFKNYSITYKTFFLMNKEFYSEKYEKCIFKLFSKDKKKEDKDEDEEFSNFLIIKKIIIPGNLINADKFDIQIFEVFGEGKNVDNNKMIIKRVEIYKYKYEMDINYLEVILPEIEVSRFSKREIRMIDGVYIDGGKVSAKKEICGKLRCIYNIPGSRKEHIRYKRRLITVAEYKKLMKAWIIM